MIDIFGPLGFPLLPHNFASALRGLLLTVLGKGEVRVLAGVEQHPIR